MSLVAYDDSEESGIESENEDSSASTARDSKPAGVEECVKKTHNAGQTPVVKTRENDMKEDYNSVPAAPKSMHLPSSHTSSINFDMKILDKNRSQPIRITIPSLKDFEEEEPKKPKLRPSTRGSSLFSILPPPKNVTTSASAALMPQSVSKAQKPKPTPVKRPKKPAAPKKENGDEEDFSSSEPLTSFFFSGADEEPLPPPIDIETPVVMEDSPSSSSSAVPLTQHNQVTTSASEMANSGVFANSVPFEAPEAGNPYHPQTPEEDQALLDAEALRKLCGSRDRKKGPDLSEIIDVNGSTLVGDSSMILAKELTKEQPTHSFKRKSECSSLQRRKHQITYLAEQAKAQELELRNNWAQNRVTRKQTQAKYGF